MDETYSRNERGDGAAGLHGVKSCPSAFIIL